MNIQSRRRGSAGLCPFDRYLGPLIVRRLESWTIWTSNCAQISGGREGPSKGGMLPHVMGDTARSAVLSYVSKLSMPGALS